FSRQTAIVKHRPPATPPQGRQSSMAEAPTVSQKPGKKRLALFLDGTWQVVADNTNVWRMKSLCAPRGADGLAQLVYYNPGVGTQFGSRLAAGMFSYGFDQCVIDAYEWLIDHYEEGDEILIFGFSRGAYSARSLAGLVAKCGLLRPGAPLGVKQIYARYRLGSEARTLWALYDDAQAGTAGALSIEEEWMLKYSLRVPITWVGVDGGRCAGGWPRHRRSASPFAATSRSRARR